MSMPYKYTELHTTYLGENMAFLTIQIENFHCCILLFMDKERENICQIEILFLK